MLLVMESNTHSAFVENGRWEIGGDAIKRKPEKNKNEKLPHPRGVIFIITSSNLIAFPGVRFMETNKNFAEIEIVLSVCSAMYNGTTNENRMSTCEVQWMAPGDIEAHARMNKK